MRRLVLFLMLAAALMSLSGCFTMDAEHNRRHLETMYLDFREMHSDLDFMLGLDEPTLLETHYR